MWSCLLPPGNQDGSSKTAQAVLFFPARLLLEAVGNWQLVQFRARILVQVHPRLVRVKNDAVGAGTTLVCSYLCFRHLPPIAQRTGGNESTGPTDRADEDAVREEPAQD